MLGRIVRGRRSSWSRLLYSQQQRPQHGGSSGVSKDAEGEPPKPNWLTVQSGQKIGSVLIVMIPYLDLELLRVYASGVGGAASPLSDDQLQKLIGTPHEAASRCCQGSVLKAAASSKIPVRPPPVASPPYCSLVQNFFSVGTTPKTFRGIPLGPSVHTPGIVCLTHYMLTPLELHARGFPGFERGTDPEVPDGYITLEGLPGAADSEHPRRSLLYGVDCEMVDTENGKELGRVCVVDSNCEVILDELVKPSGPVVDYLTQFSGLTKEILDEATLSLQDVHALLKRRLQVGAILVGHSLEYDLRALRLVHWRCIDTTVLYPHNREGLMLSLKKLAQLYLKKTMKRVRGHDPQEDAQAAMLLTLKKIENGPGFAVPMTQLGPLASAMRKLQADRSSSAATQNTPGEEAPGSVCGQENQECLFLVDSFKYSFTSPLQGVLIVDGLADDEAVIRACKKCLRSGGSTTPSGLGSSLLPSEAASDQEEKFKCTPRWGVCVLRAYQRLCSLSLRAPTDRLYAFNYLSSKLLTAEAQLRNQRTQHEQAHSGLTGNTLQACSEKKDGKGLVHDVKSLFPPVPTDAAMQIIAHIDRLLGELAASLQPQDVIILLSPCGDAYSLRFFKSALEGDELANEKESALPLRSNSVVPADPLEWSAEFQKELDKAKSAFEGPTRGGWCSIVTRHSTS
ncbi:hypothetical protein Emag_001772 [Eimeria magna]